MKTEKEVLQTTADNLQIGMQIVEKQTNDKRKSVKRYFATIDGNSISPVLDYEQMNHFLLGWHKAKKHFNY